MERLKECYKKRIENLKEEKKWKIESVERGMNNFKNGYSVCCLKNSMSRLEELIEIETELEKYEEFLTALECFN